jgi:hypothetical protein
MNAIATLRTLPFVPAILPASRKEQFRLRFQRCLRACVRRGFSIEESFGMIWEETWEEIALTDAEQCELYEELIEWAKKEAFLRAY